MKRARKLLWRLYPTYLLTVIPALVAIALIASHEIRVGFTDQITRGLEARARLMGDLVSTDLGSCEQARIQPECRRMGQVTDTRYTVMLPDGRVVGDSEQAPSTMENHSTRPEMAAALAGSPGSATRHSATIGEDMLYVAVPVSQDGGLLGVVRASVPVTHLDEMIGRIHRQIALAGLVVALLAAVASLFVAHAVGRPLRQMVTGAARYADGDLGYRLEVPDIEEAALLAGSMNRMASQLDERIRTVTRQRNELEAVLSSMIEAVVVVDTEGRLIRTNRAARTLFVLYDIDDERLTIQETIRNADLNRFVERILSGEAPLEGEILLHRGQERHLLAHGTMLVDVDDKKLGALVVLNDVTRLKKLESVRRDFVANVSHELKTPITSIKGFVETLRDGAMGDRENADRFLGIIMKHADRLEAIIEDLLSLSRIEQESESGQIRLERSHVCGVVQSALAVTKPKADARNIRITAACPPDLESDMNAPLVEQAIVNLVDNAIKYSDEGSEVLVNASVQEEEMIIEVIDTGCGISREHLDRIFERFYRIDRARSRKLGGTGLGLAIVKHIASAHGGLVTVLSQPDHGSTFTIRIPGRQHRSTEGKTRENQVC